VSESHIKTTIDEIRLPLPIRITNKIGKTLDKWGIHLAELSAEKLLANAQRKTALTDWGDDKFSDEFKFLISSYRQDGHLTLVGRIAMRMLFSRWLQNRLLTQRDFEQHPEILQSPIRKPLFVTGFPRSGTTLLHRLLSQDPRARIPLLWELLYPSPPPTTEGRENDPRIKAAGKLLKQAEFITPQVKVIHSLDPRESEECIWLLEEFFSMVHANVETYMEWLLTQDLIRHYKWYRTQLQLLQWRCPGDHWVLKTPFHLFAMDTILTVFPAACIVQTHRDPETVLASFCSLIATSRSIYSENIDLKQIGESALHFWEIAIQRAMKVREENDPSRFYDVYYNDLLTDPMHIVRGIYAHFGYDFTAEMEHNITAWLKQNPQYKHGKHRYSLEQFGLTKAQVQERFAAYTARFGSKIEV
jgi:hypothetical protein